MAQIENHFSSKTEVLAFFRDLPDSKAIYLGNIVHMLLQIPNENANDAIDALKIQHDHEVSDLKQQLQSARQKLDREVRNLHQQCEDEKREWKENFRSQTDLTIKNKEAELKADMTMLRSENQSLRAKVAESRGVEAAVSEVKVILAQQQAKPTNTRQIADAGKDYVKGKLINAGLVVAEAERVGNQGGGDFHVNFRGEDVVMQVDVKNCKTSIGPNEVSRFKDIIDRTEQVAGGILISMNSKITAGSDKQFAITKTTGKQKPVMFLDFFIHNELQDKMIALAARALMAAILSNTSTSGSNEALDLAERTMQNQLESVRDVQKKCQSFKNGLNRLLKDNGDLVTDLTSKIAALDETYKDFIRLKSTGQSRKRSAPPDDDQTDGGQPLQRFLGHVVI